MKLFYVFFYSSMAIVILTKAIAFMNQTHALMYICSFHILHGQSSFQQLSFFGLHS